MEQINIQNDNNIDNNNDNNNTNQLEFEKLFNPIETVEININKKSKKAKKK